jgi:DNA-binding XRE family transcriptional regulator
MSDLERWRIDNGCTQQQLGQRLGVVRSAVCRWEKSGHVPRLKVAEVSRLTGIPAGKLNPEFKGKK